MVPTMARMSPMKSPILLTVMKLPGIRFMPDPVPKIRAITPTVIRVICPLLLAHSMPRRPSCLTVPT